MRRPRADRPCLRRGQPQSNHQDHLKSLRKRGEPRYKCEGSAEFRTEGFEVRTWARVTDLSRSGCYIEMQATSPLNTAVSLMIEVNGLRLHLKGAVKTSYPMQGMGVAFTEIPDTDLLQLDVIIASWPADRQTRWRQSPREARVY